MTHHFQESKQILPTRPCYQTHPYNQAQNSTYTVLLKNAFMYEKFFNSKTTSSTGIFLIMFFSTRIVKEKKFLRKVITRKIFCISSMIAHDSEGTLIFYFVTFLRLLVCMQKIKSYFVETQHFFIFLNFCFFCNG